MATVLYKVICPEKADF